MGEIIEFGSLYLDGKPVYPETSYKGGEIEIGTTVAGKRLKWYFTGGRLMASECILKDISWDALNAWCMAGKSPSGPCGSTSGCSAATWMNWGNGWSWSTRPAAPLTLLEAGC